MTLSPSNITNFQHVDPSDSDDSLHKMLCVIRKHLDMEVAFFSKFVSGERIFRAIDHDSNVSPDINVGDSDPINESYCGKICQGEFEKVIHDAKNHELAKDLEVTEKLDIGSYLGVPIVLSDGEVFGTLCCYKSEADNTLNQRDLSFLNAFAEIYRELFEERMKNTTLYDQMAQTTLSALECDVLDIHYQPIYSVETGAICGYECLARFNTSPYRTPDVWFDEAEKVGMGEALQLKAIEQALNNMHRLPIDTSLSLNIAPEYILNGSIHKLLEGVDISRLILEVTEHSPINDYIAFRKKLAPLRERGMQLAIDDAGAGYSSFQHILELEADLIKLDLSLIRDIHIQPKKLALAKALCAFAKSTSCVIIAEGVEVVDELKVLQQLGVDRIQGYLTGKPMVLNEALAHQFTLPL